MSTRANVYPDNCLSIQMSPWQISTWTNVCPDRCLLGKMSAQKNIYPDKDHQDKCLPSPNGFAIEQRPCVLTPKPVGPGPCPWSSSAMWSAVYNKETSKRKHRCGSWYTNTCPQAFCPGDICPGLLVWVYMVAICPGRHLSWWSLSG